MVHVLPIDDVKPHIESGEYCPCAPRVDGDVVVHNAFDGHEFYEDEWRERIAIASDELRGSLKTGN